MCKKVRAKDSVYYLECFVRVFDLCFADTKESARKMEVPIFSIRELTYFLRYCT